MPIYEYACRSCDRQFEYLTRDGQVPACPGCASQALDRQMSTFAARTSTGASASPTRAAGPCGSCGDPRGPGACSIN